MAKKLQLGDLMRGNAGEIPNNKNLKALLKKDKLLEKIASLAHSYAKNLCVGCGLDTDFIAKDEIESNILFICDQEPFRALFYELYISDLLKKLGRDERAAFLKSYFLAAATIYINNKIERVLIAQKIHKQMRVRRAQGRLITTHLRKAKYLHCKIMLERMVNEDF